MYLSHKYKFLFLRVPKTASSSLSEFFIKNIPDKDAIYTDVVDSGIPGTLDKGMFDFSRHEKFRYLHLTLTELLDKNIITEEQALSYRCVAVLRDPIDRQKSFYHFYKNWKSKYIDVSIDDYLRLAPNGFFPHEPNSKIPQTDFLSINNTIIGEYWLYENINQSLQTFMSEIGVNIKFPLSSHKSNFRKKQTEIDFDEHCIDKLKAHFYNDFELYEKMKNETNSILKI